MKSDLSFPIKELFVSHEKKSTSNGAVITIADEQIPRRKSPDNANYLPRLSLTREKALTSTGRDWRLSGNAATSRPRKSRVAADRVMNDADFLGIRSKRPPRIVPLASCR